MISAPGRAVDGTLTDLSAAHARIMEDPGNLEFLYAYAHAAIRLGNYEAAIGALESMLIIAGNQPRLLLEIGVLYQRLGAPRTAQAYLKRARQYADKGSADAADAQRFLHGAGKQTADHAFRGFLRFGLRYQSNPLRAPEVDEILSGGIRIPRPESRRPDEDVNAFLLSRVEHRYRLGPRTSLVSDAIVYGTAYDEQDQLDYGLVEFSTGPQYASPANAGGQYSVRPFLLYRASRLDDHAYEHTPGAGLDFGLRPNADSRFRAIYQYRDKDFQNPNGTGSADLRSGEEHRLDLRYRWEFLPGQAISARVFGRRSQAQRDYFETDQLDLSLRYSLKIRNSLFEGRPRMTLTPYVIRRVKDYEAADPAIDPSTVRQDKEWRFGLSYQLPFTASWSLILNYEHTQVDSNIVNFDADNDLFMVGLQMGF